MDAYAVISNDAGHYKGFFLGFLLSPGTPLHCCTNSIFSGSFPIIVHPNLLGLLALHQLSVAHQTSLQSRSTMMSHANSLSGGG
jgi:hypothetical protein